MNVIYSIECTAMGEDSDSHQVTRLLAQIAEGNSSARDELIEAVYQQLRQIARVRMAAERPNHTLQATELVHEAYLKLAPGLEKRDLKNHYDFFGAAAEAMRRILIDHARRRKTEKRGGGVSTTPIGNVAQLADTDDPEAVIALNEAFENLESEHPELAELIRLRFFAGLSVEETARVMGTSIATVKRHWRLARTMLFNALERET